MKPKSVMPSVLLLAVLCTIFCGVNSLSAGAIQPKEKIIALNFDDGPKPTVLKELLPLLEKYRIPAAFFVIGSAISQNEALIKLMRAKGFAIENHSWGHENFRKLYKIGGERSVAGSLDKTGDAIFAATGRRPGYFRPPFWEINQDIERIVSGQGLKIMKLCRPDINTLDYEDAARHRSSQALVERVKKIVSDRERRGIRRHVLVFHELLITTEALKKLIPYFLAEGYEFKHLDDME